MVPYVRVRFPLNTLCGGVAQLEEHLTFNQVVGSSSLLTLTFGKIAQLVEQRTENPRVIGSIPILPTYTRLV